MAAPRSSRISLGAQKPGSHHLCEACPWQAATWPSLPRKCCSTHGNCTSGWLKGSTQVGWKIRDVFLQVKKTVNQFDSLQISRGANAMRRFKRAGTRLHLGALPCAKSPYSTAAPGSITRPISCYLSSHELQNADQMSFFPPETDPKLSLWFPIFIEVLHPCLKSRVPRVLNTRAYAILAAGCETAAVGAAETSVTSRTTTREDNLSRHSGSTTLSWARNHEPEANVTKE